MGLGSSSFSGFTDDMLDEYVTLTYLSRTEILNLFKTFMQLGQEQINRNFHHRFDVREVEELFPQLRYNPFRHRIYQVFSSHRDFRFSFEDLLDLCSVMSDKCPDKVKAAWAFRVYDYDEDGAIGAEDIMRVIDQLTREPEPSRIIDEEGKMRIVKVLLDEMDLESSGTIGPLEFAHAVGKMSEFPHSFCFRS